MISSNKHILQFVRAGIAQAAIANNVIAKSVAVPDSAATASEVKEGSVIRSVFVEMWITSDDATQGAVVVTLEKKPSSHPVMTNTQAFALNSYTNKNNILFTSQGLTPPNLQSGIPYIRQWVKIPKGKQRMALNDQLILNIAPDGTDGCTQCGLSIYKELT